MFLLYHAYDMNYGTDAESIYWAFFENLTNKKGQDDFACLSFPRKVNWHLTITS